MKIAVMVHSLDAIGGIAKHTLYLCRELVAMGHQVTVYAIEFNRELCYPEITRDLDMRWLHSAEPMQSWDTRLPKSFRMVSYLAVLWHYYHTQFKLAAGMEHGYDIINAHGNNISWATAEYRRQHQTPVVWLSNDFVPVASQRYEQVSGVSGRVKHAMKTGLVWPITHYDETAVREMDMIAVLSERVQSQMQNHYRVQPRIVRPGVDHERFACGDGAKIRAQYGVSDNTFLVLTVSMPMPRRRIEDVIEAVRLLVAEGRDVMYMVVGRTTYHQHYCQLLEQQAAASNLQGRIILTGEVPEHDLVNCYHACDAFVWASDENQSWGMAGMEAMAAGKPAIVSTANGLAEVLEDGTMALLVPPRSPETIAHALGRLMTDSTLAAALSRTGRQFVRERYGWRNHAEEMLTLFEETIAQRV